jgi:hypothetical protein
MTCTTATTLKGITSTTATATSTATTIVVVVELCHIITSLTKELLNSTSSIDITRHLKEQIGLIAKIITGRCELHHSRQQASQQAMNPETRIVEGLHYRLIDWL